MTQLGKDVHAALRDFTGTVGDRIVGIHDHLSTLAPYDPLSAADKEHTGE